MSPSSRGRGRRAETDAFLTQRRRKRRRGRTKARHKRFARLVLGSIVGGILFLVASSFTGAAIWMSSCNLNSLKPAEVGENSFIFAADGSLLGSIPAEKNLQPVPLEKISSWVPKATIAIEDRRFYDHGALDWLGIVRALYKDIQAGKVVQGGSTITQQLVRNLYIKKKSQTLGRKATEACLAIKLAREKSKTWILAAYMNQVYYGNHAYGIEAAAQTYFSKPARKLTLRQAALLAGLPQAPSLFDPFHERARALTRRDEVLRAMLDSGYITSTTYAAAISDRHLHLKAGKLYTRIREPYFFSYVRELLQKEYGAATVQSGGLKVYTTIDPRLQFFAQRAIRQTLYYKTDPAAAIVSINPANGAIRAMTEVTPGNSKNQVNFLSSAHRQPGSTFKMIVLTTAISQGISPSTSYLSAPFKYDPTGIGSCDSNPPTAWCPETYAHTYLGTTTIERGTLASDNTVYARLSLDVGPDNIAAMAKKLGIQTDLHAAEGVYVPSMGLGSRVVTPMDMASAYATIWIGYPQGEIPMTYVHGISVSGPTFPATIWKLFMERAVDYAPFPTEFPTPKSSPEWKYHHLQYALSGATYSSSSSGNSYTPPASAKPKAPTYTKAPPPQPTTPAPPPPPPQ